MDAPRTDRGFPLPPPALAALAGLAQHRLARRAGAQVTATSRVAAAALAACSVGLEGAAVSRFRRERTTVSPFAPTGSTVLVTSGPNGITRNPMYLGMAGLLVAHAVLRRSPSALLPVGLFVLAIDRLQVPSEERALAARFGAEYADYRRRVPRWLGRLTA